MMKRLKILSISSVGNRKRPFSYRSRINPVLIPYRSRIVLLSFSYRSPIVLASGSGNNTWRKRSIPTHSGWLYPLTFDAGKGLKEA